ncbi:(Putative ring-cleaving dioxygenase MhqA [Alteracholeplasma palmae J233]|uniref:(Putative ring-cleaving dioxygenase MhqA) n=1 Tax=Alteracholeplasma palmae (strain ATCC 49389 / J233) TaxID=1318466 RepID=U4KKY7_ALTPJ|nr:ring-cleaving dioxygenase [Alteracholeplasma palmae]CCV64368.1 (Putative ring-cleaving dioxygenase MhqA [Alteracholeplasma palmae J233]
MKILKGIHHVTAITSSAEKIYEFFTYTLGLRLVKKTINQDDINTYHLFFADDKGSAGTDMTFFDFQGISKAKFGTNEISRTGFRVPNDKALEYWLKRFNHYNVKHTEIKTLFGKKVIYFNDFDDQRYILFSDENNTGIESGTPWLNGPVPNEFAITGLGPIFLTVSNFDTMDLMLSKILGMTKKETEGQFTLYEMGTGGNGASVIVEKNLILPNAVQGFGGVHHVAFRVEDRSELEYWQKKFAEFRAPNSGLVDRFYFESLYTRLYPNILFELATEGPGFIDDQEPYETLGEMLALPPRFRDRRDYVESVVRPINTKRSDKTFKKEYF